MLTDEYLAKERRERIAEARARREMIGELEEYGAHAEVTFKKPGDSNISSLRSVDSFLRNNQIARCEYALVAIENSYWIDSNGKVVLSSETCELHEDCCLAGDHPLRKDCAFEHNKQAAVIMISIHLCLQYCRGTAEVFPLDACVQLETLSGKGPPQPGTGVWRLPEVPEQAFDKKDRQWGDRCTKAQGSRRTLCIRLEGHNGHHESTGGHTWETSDE